MGPATRLTSIAALLLIGFADTAGAALPCGNGAGPIWSAPKELGSVAGALFYLAVTIPQCVGDLQDVAINVKNPTDSRLRIRFQLDILSVGGVHDLQRESGVIVNGHWNRDSPQHIASAFRAHDSVVPDPSLVIASVTLRHVTVCVENTTPGPVSSTYIKPCAQQSNTLSGTPACPNGAPDPTYGYTPLMLAARNGDLGSVIYFLTTCGMNPNARATDGYTALMFAANTGLVPIVDVLLKAGADINAQQDRGLTALGIVKDGAPEMADFLRRHGGR